MEPANNNSLGYQVAEVELVYKTRVKSSQRPKVNSSKEIYELLQKIWNPETIELCEEFKVLLLNQSNRVLGFLDISRGGITSTVVDTRMVLAAAIKALAVNMVLVHNHPSGNLKPSRNDQELTQKIKTAASYMDIKVLDHIIITAEGYFSFADEGLL